MSFLGRFLPTFMNGSSKLPQILAQNPAKLHSAVVPNVPTSTSLGPLFGSITRSIVRCHFPRPNERMRIRKHGFKTRMSTPAGRRILMNRILKGKWVYSH